VVLEAQLIKLVTTNLLRLFRIGYKYRPITTLIFKKNTAALGRKL